MAFDFGVGDVFDVLVERPPVAPRVEHLPCSVSPEGLMEPLEHGAARCLSTIKSRRCPATFATSGRRIAPEPVDPSPASPCIPG